MNRYILKLNLYYIGNYWQLRRTPMSEYSDSIKALFKPLAYQLTEYKDPTEKGWLNKLATLVKPLPLKMLIISTSDTLLKHISNGSATLKTYQSIQCGTMELLLQDLKDDLKAYDKEVKDMKAEILNLITELNESFPNNEHVKTFSKEITEQLIMPCITKLPHNIIWEIEDKDTPKALKLKEIEALFPKSDKNTDISDYISFNSEKITHYERILKENESTEKNLLRIYELLLNLKYSITRKISEEIIYGLHWANPNCLNMSPVLARIVENHACLYSDMYKSLSDTTKKLIFIPYTEKSPDDIFPKERDMLNKSALKQTRKELRECTTPQEQYKLLGIGYPWMDDPDFLILLAKLRTLINYYVAENIAPDIYKIAVNELPVSPKSPLPLTQSLNLHLNNIKEITKDSLLFDDTYAEMPDGKMNHLSNFKIFMDKFNLMNKEIAATLGISEPNFNKLKDKDNPSLFLTLSLLYGFTYEFFAGATTIPDYGKKDTNLYADPQIANRVENIYRNYNYPMVDGFINDERLISKLLYSFSDFMVSLNTKQLLATIPEKYTSFVTLFNVLHQNAESINADTINAILVLLGYKSKSKMTHKSNNVKRPKK